MLLVDFKWDSNIMLYIAVVILLLVIAISLNRGKKVAKVIAKFVLGGIVIYFINLVGKNFNFNIPLNPFTALTVGLLEFPGFVLILLVKYIIYP